MADGKKTFQIVINGIQESIDAVTSLNKQLDELGERIKNLQGKAVKVSASSTGGGSKSSSSSALSEEEKLEKQIVQLEEKRIAHSKQIYQNYLAAKDVLKETENDQKQLAAAERVQANTYSNTMEGIKQKLADLKSVHFTTDISTDEFKKQTEEINELTNKLKKLEEEYGVFSRNVGNYKSAFDGFEKLKINVAEVTLEFDNAKQALKSLQGDLRTLQAKKDQGMILSEDEVKRFEELPEIVAQLKSSIQDAGKPMDNIMDAMESIVAIVQTTKGMSAFFGLDGDEIERSIQKLVALQNAMKGIQTINKQLQSREGIGGWLSKASSAMDAFAANVTKTDKAANRLALSLKVLTGIAVVAFIYGIVKSLKDLKKEEDQVNKVTEEGIKEYAKAESELSVLKKKLDNFNGSKKQEKRLVEELNSKYGSSLGQYKSLAGWKDALRKKGSAYCQVLQKEAELQAILSLYTENYIKLQKARQAQDAGMQDTVDLILKTLNGEANIKQVLASIRDDIKAPLSDNLNEYNNELQKEVDEYKDKGKKLLAEAEKIQNDIAEINKKNEIFDYSDQIDENEKKTKEALEKAVDDLNKTEISAMEDGLNKKLLQLEEEKRQTINKLKQNGIAEEETIKRVNDVYYAKRIKVIDDYIKQLDERIRNSSKKIAEVEFHLNTKDVEQQILDLKNKIEEINQIVPKDITLTTNAEYKGMLGDISDEDYKVAGSYDFYVEGLSNGKVAVEEFYNFLDEFVAKQNEELRQEFQETYINIGTGIENVVTDYEAVQDYIEKTYGNAISVIRQYGYKYDFEQKKVDTSLNNSFKFRLEATERYNSEYISQILKAIDEEKRIRKEANDYEVDYLRQKELEEYQVRDKALQDDINEAQKDIDDIMKNNRDLTVKETERLEELKKLKSDAQANANKNLSQYYVKAEQITRDYVQKDKDIEKQAIESKQQTQQKYYDGRITDYRDFINKLNQETSKNPVKDTVGWDVVMAITAKKNYREVVSASTTTIDSIRKDKAKLDADFAKGLIKPEAYNATLKQFNDVENSAVQALETTKEKQKMLVADFIQSIQVYLNGAMDLFGTIMDAVWAAQDAAFDKEQEALDKENEELDDALDKQQQIVERHKNAIDSIEDELANSRGDRRQHLIDQLNAEMEARRAAEAEEQRIQRQQEANKKKQEALDKERRKAEYKRNMIQAIVNGAMAVTMAAINKWPIPAIPMMALAGATTAAQIAIMAANKPYAKGGQLEGGVAVGPRHRDGGIPVLGGRASIEGGEFITNRLSTEKNIDLLEYVNAKKRRVDLSDLIEFYNGNSVKTSIQRVKTKFEDGGYIPTLPNSLDIKDQLQDVIINQDNRPIYVSVVDINNKQNDVRRVQTLAGLNDE